MLMMPILHLGQSMVSVSSKPFLQDNLGFLANAKYRPPDKALCVETVLNESSLDALRLVSETAVLIDRHIRLKKDLI